METYLAVDIGASSGRHILGWVEEGRLCLEEIYRFENTLVRKKRPPLLGHGALGRGDPAGPGALPGAG